MAVPTGDYAVEMSLDLPPSFGLIQGSSRATLVDPGPEALDRCIARALSKDWVERRDSISELALFKDDGERVVPALMKLLDDPREGVRGDALDSLSAFPVLAAAHTRRFLMIAIKGEEYERGMAIDLVGETAPDTDIVRRVLRLALCASEPWVADTAERALTRLSERHR
ncbi:MAG: hypothetical protein ACYS99_16835 [Planctomycetota bacterium]